jgi:hypothetical protein
MTADHTFSGDMSFPEFAEVFPKQEIIRLILHVEFRIHAGVHEYRFVSLEEASSLVEKIPV